MNKDQLLTVLKISFPILLLAFAIFEIQKTVSGIDINSFRYELGQIHPWELVLVIIVSFSAIIPMLFYDVILAKVLKITVRTRSLLQHSFITNTFSNLIGFGGLVGVMLRSYFYSKYKEEKEGILKNIASVTLFYLTGISLLMWIVPLFYWNFPLLKETKWLLIAVILLSLYFPIFIGIFIMRYRKVNAYSISAKAAVQLIITSVAEWISVFLVILFLTVVLNIPIELSALIPIFLIASSAGIVSMIPGGVGSFDLVFLWGTQSIGIADEKILFLLILYRVGYFVLPFLFSALLFVKEYWRRWNHSWDDVPNVIAQKMSHTLLTILVFVSGIVLLLSASVPGVLSRLKVMQEFLSLPIMNLSHHLTVAAGFILLGLCRGIQYRVKRTYQLTIIVLCSAALFSIIKGFDYEEAIFLMIVMGLLIVSKSQFYRESYVLTWGIILIDVAVVAFITSMYVFIGYLNLPTSKIHIPIELRDYIITDSRDLFYSAVIGLVIAGVILFIGSLIRKPKQMEMLSSVDQAENVENHLIKYAGTEFSHLIFLHDKYIYWNKEETVLFSYQVYADKIVVLGDMVGIESDYSSAIEDFLKTADLYGYTPVFYEVSTRVLALLHDQGYGFFKLGEEAFVDLGTFTLSGKKMKGFRAVKNKFERENHVVEILSPPFSSELLKELEDVSTRWLQGRREKGFSLGFFDEDYLNTAQVAVLRNEDGIIGFASLMPMYDNGERISIDLMRYNPDAPSGTMDFIFLSLFEWAKEEGYHVFNIGMSPLSNVGKSRYSFLSEKIAAQIFLHGQYFYHFQGLKNFKQKYADSWEAKYVAYRKKSSLPFTIAQITLLIGRKGK
ncbi:bifunctional lysylphosphatidylglycerol flippase/synthetase MprF [Sporosarcina sp. BI001-red]|uniref:bifunctional lysylphosphatidylglycerol flippase/synthetase MprF n=1 Tax=Sporosarcina sp. BI001-red TaxID=2282866 RepID=UPI001F3B0B5F|nr:bifunctional lysylphosphatidylglycerol flippase/synthetase MprF [Sporosarcina sp. BI001-red]